MKILREIFQKDSIKLALLIMSLDLPELLSYYSGYTGTVPLRVLQLSMLCFLLLLPYCNMKQPPNKVRGYFVWCFIIMAILSLLNMTPTMPILTVTSICSLMILGTFGKRINLTVLNHAFCIVSIVYIPILFYQLLKMDFDLNTVLRRGYAWTEIFVYATLTKIWFAFLFTSVISKKHILFAVFLWIMSIVINIISLKRAIFVDSAIAYIIILFVIKKSGDIKAFKKLLTVAVLLGFVMTFYLAKSSISNDTSEIFNAVETRFTDTSNDIENFDRFIEGKRYFDTEASYFDIVFGKGFLSTHSVLGKEHFALHIGWVNWVFKGGIVFLLCILLSYCRVFQIINHPKEYSMEVLFSAMYALYFFFTCFYVNYMGFGITLFLFFYSLMIVNQKNLHHGLSN